MWSRGFQLEFAAAGGFKGPQWGNVGASHFPSFFCVTQAVITC